MLHDHNEEFQRALLKCEMPGARVHSAWRLWAILGWLILIAVMIAETAGCVPEPVYPVLPVSPVWFEAKVLTGRGVLRSIQPEQPSLPPRPVLQFGEFGTQELRKERGGIWKAETQKGGNEGKEFTSTEASWRAMLPAVGKASEPPEGPGREGNKPLMRNLTANESHPRWVIAGNTFKHLTREGVREEW